MNRYLRKKHLQAWSLIAVLLPLSFIAALTSRKAFMPHINATPTAPALLPVQIGEQNIDGNSLQLRTDRSTGATQLVWINKTALQVPTATIYAINPGAPASVGPIDLTANNTRYIGRIETRGQYAFALPDPADRRFIVYDFIHDSVMYRVNFKR